MTKRIYNFNPGPAVLPLSVLKEVQEEMLNYKDSGMSILEISHRSELFNEILSSARDRVKRLLNLNDDYKVLFIQGGASLQFAMLALNLLKKDERADYVNTGTWSTKAFEQAKHLNKNVRYAASSEDREFSYIPKTIDLDEKARYLHLTSNNTIRGTQWQSFPDTGDIPLVCDMCSDIFSRPLDMEKFGLIYAGAQKNLGPAGLTLVIIKKELLDWGEDQGIPHLLRYKTYFKHYSMYNTPPCFSIYVAEKTLAWLEEEIGGLKKMAALNQKKAELIYSVLDSSDFYQGTAAREDRSLMNITFRLKDNKLEESFIREALKAGLGGLKGHKSVGGCRASIYNANGIEAAEALADFMKNFEKDMG